MVKGKLNEMAGDSSLSAQTHAILDFAVVRISTLD